MKHTFSIYKSHYKATIKLGWPILVGQLGVIVVGFADTLMVGRYNTDALAAASFVNNIFTLISLLIMGFSYGLTPLISAHYSRGEHAEAGVTFKNAIISNLLYTALLLIVMGIFYFFLDRMGQEEKLLPLMRPYYLIIWTSMLFVALFNIMKQFADGTLDTAKAMWILLSGNVINIVGNYMLIYGNLGAPELGLTGAGLSTWFARLCMAVLFAVILLRSKRYLPFRAGFQNGKITTQEVKRISRLSLPVSLQMGMETGSFTFSAVMAGWISAVTLASYQIIVTIGTLGFLFYYSIGASLAIRVGGFTGLGDKVSIRRAAFAGCHILLVWAAVASVLFFFFGQPLISLFSNDPDVIKTAVALILPLIMYQFADAMQICFANALRGMTDVVAMMWIAFVSYLIVGIPTGYFLGFVMGWGETGIFLAFSVGLFMAAVLFYKRFLRISKL